MDRPRGMLRGFHQGRSHYIPGGCRPGSLPAVSPQADRTKPMRDSSVRKALRIAAQDAGCDFEGFGLHSFRRANITWRQEVGVDRGSAVKAGQALAVLAAPEMAAQVAEAEAKAQAVEA